ncbi:MAG: PQQ-binding-like beta-propeller repeat protein [Bacteroidales bacterium]|jgi:outer membrane protein assembly factor BamB|nr:PQQ-binding-like beta-propeller repeat protein [Bacteroidales bacterium]
MKTKFFLMAALLTGAMFTRAQDDMPVVWESKMDHKIQYNGTGTEERGYSYAASDKEITVFENATGKVKWTKRFKDVAPKLGKIDELIPFWESNIIFLFDRKLGKDQIACVDMETGTFLWSTDKYQDVSEDNVVYIPEEQSFAISMKKEMVFIKAKTGEERWSTVKFKGVVGAYVYTSDGYLVTVNFVPSSLGALFSGFKNQIAKINVKNGDIVWENTYIGRAERKAVSREFLYDLFVEGDKVILRMNGYQVYDIKTGASLWSAAFDYTPDGLAGRPAGAKRFGVYGGVADPVRVGDDLYVLDMSNKRNQYIKKYDFNSGKLLWTSPEIKDARAIPNMYVMGDKILLQIGGTVEAQAYIYKRTNNPDGSVTITEEWRIWYPNIKPNGVQAFSTTDGKLIWDSERFRKGITNMIEAGDRVIVSSGKALYSMDVNTGKEYYEVPVAKGGVGNAEMIFPYKDMVTVIGEKGVSTFKMNNGDLVGSGKYKTSALEDRFDNIVVMKTSGADIAAFNLDSNNYLEFKARKGATTTLTTDGKFVYVYENKTVTKVKTTK